MVTYAATKRSGSVGKFTGLVRPILLKDTTATSRERAFCGSSRLVRADLENSSTFPMATFSKTVATDVISKRPIVVAYFLYSLTTGGLERYVTRLANGLDRDRFLPMIICLTYSGDAADWITSEDVAIVELNKKQESAWQISSELSRILQQYHVDILHSHNWCTLLESLLARVRSKTPVHVHAERGTVLGTVEFHGFRNRIRGLIAGLAMRSAKAVVTNGPATAQRIQERCRFPGKGRPCDSHGVALENKTIERSQFEVAIFNAVVRRTSR